jgi:hypothetical protein
MIKLDHIAGLIAVAAIVALSLWPLKGHGGDEQEHGGDEQEHGGDEQEHGG